MADPGMGPPKAAPPKRYREALGSIIARLQGQVLQQQRAIDGELQERFDLEVTAVLVLALNACTRGFHCAMRSGSDDPATIEALADADAKAADVVRMIGADAPLPEDFGRPGAPWPAGALGIPPSEYIRRVLKAREVPMERDEFVAWMRGVVHEMALLIRQQQAGSPEAGAQLAELTKDFVLNMCGYVLKPWGATLATLNMETGEQLPEAQFGEYVSIVRASRPTDRDLLVFRLVNRWWKEYVQVLAKERRDLAAEALKQPGDVVLQDEVSAALTEVNFTYVCVVSAAGALMSTLVNAPDRMAQTWVASWPRYSVLTPMLEAYAKLSEERARGASSGSGTATGPSLPSGGIGGSGAGGAGAGNGDGGNGASGGAGGGNGASG